MTNNTFKNLILLPGIGGLTRYFCSAATNMIECLLHLLIIILIVTAS
jgi:hypothetical protein